MIYIYNIYISFTIFAHVIKSTEVSTKVADWVAESILAATHWGRDKITDIT